MSASRYFRVFDSAGTLETTMTKARARGFASSGYCVEVWDLTGDTTVGRNRLLELPGGTGPAALAGGLGEKVGRIEEVYPR